MVRTQSVLIEDTGPHVRASIATQAFCTETNAVLANTARVVCYVSQADGLNMALKAGWLLSCTSISCTQECV